MYPQTKPASLPALALVLSLALAALSGSCSKTEPPPAAPPATAPVHAPQPPPASAPLPDDAAALKEMAELESRGLQAVSDMDHGLLARTIEGLQALSFRKQENSLRRDALAEALAAEAVKLRDAQHRFLFVELQRLPTARRAELLEKSDGGEADAIALSAAALAEHDFRAGRRSLRATAELGAGAADPITGLPVRRAGDVKMLWQQQFNGAYNQQFRRLLAEAATSQPR